MKIKALTEEKELELEQNLVWVYGFPNNAVTLLSKQLVCDKFHFLDKPQICKEPGMVKLGLNSVRTAWEWRSDPDYFFSKKYSKTWMFYLRKLILNRIFSQFQDTSNKIIINEPEVVGALSIVSKIFPKSKIIFIIPNNLSALIDSFTSEVSIDRNKLHITTIFSLDKNKIRNVVSNRFEKFKEIVLDAYNLHQADLRCLVKYEDLKNSTFTELQKIFQFTDIETNEDELKKIIKKYNFSKSSEQDRKIEKIKGSD